MRNAVVTSGHFIPVDLVRASVALHLGLDLWEPVENFIDPHKERRVASIAQSIEHELLSFHFLLHIHNSRRVDILVLLHVVVEGDVGDGLIFRLDVICNGLSRVVTVYKELDHASVWNLHLQLGRCIEELEIHDVVHIYLVKLPGVVICRDLSGFLSSRCCLLCTKRPRKPSMFDIRYAPLQHFDYNPF